MHNNYCTGLKCLINELHYSVLVLLQSLAVLNIDCQSRFQNFQYVRYYHNIVILHDIVDCSTAEQQTVSTQSDSAVQLQLLIQTGSSTVVRGD